MFAILDTLKTAFKTEFGATFNTYLIGRNKIVAEQDMPLLMIYGTDESQDHSGTLRDQAEFNITVEITVKLKDYFDNINGQGEQLDAYEALVKLVGERDSNGKLLDGTVMGIINNNLTVGALVLYTNNIRANYEPYMDAGEFPEARALITFTAFDRPDR